MGNLADQIVRLHAAVFGTMERALDGWFLGLAARFTFASVLYLYFWNSFHTKVGDGFFGFFHVSSGAYYQIALPAVLAAGGDASQVAFFPWGLMVVLGTYAEFALPLLIVAGLFTRIAAIGMIGFVAVQSIVDITVHQVGSETAGAMFDRFSDGLIWDQRLLWAFVLACLVVKGAGAVSLDWLLWRWWNGSRAVIRRSRRDRRQRLKRKAAPLRAPLLSFRRKGKLTRLSPRSACPPCWRWRSKSRSCAASSPRGCCASDRCRAGRS